MKLAISDDMFTDITHALNEEATWQQIAAPYGFQARTLRTAYLRECLKRHGKRAIEAATAAGKEQRA